MTVYEAVMNWVMESEQQKTVLHYELTTGSFSGQEMVEAIAANFTSTYLEVLVPSITWEGITVREDIPGGVGQDYSPLAGGETGTSVNDQFAHALALLVQKRANSTVRPNKGRVYQPGVTTELLGVSGTWIGGVRDVMDDFWGDMRELSLLSGGEMRMVIKASNPTAPNTVAYNPVATLQAIGNPATQRRRRIGTGI